MQRERMKIKEYCSDKFKENLQLKISLFKRKIRRNIDVVLRIKRRCTWNQLNIKNKDLICVLYFKLRIHVAKKLGELINLQDINSLCYQDKV